MTNRLPRSRACGSVVTAESSEKIRRVRFFVNAIRKRKRRRRRVQSAVEKYGSPLRHGGGQGLDAWAGDWVKSDARALAPCHRHHLLDEILLLGRHHMLRPCLDQSVALGAGSRRGNGNAA